MVSTLRQTGRSKSTLAKCMPLSAAQRFPWESQQNTEPTRGLEPFTPAPATSELFLLEEQPAPQFLGLRLIYWTATKVKAGTMCVHVLSNTSGHKIPIRT